MLFRCRFFREFVHTKKSEKSEKSKNLKNLKNLKKSEKFEKNQVNPGIFFEDLKSVHPIWE